MCLKCPRNLIFGGIIHGIALFYASGIIVIGRGLTKFYELELSPAHCFYI